MAVRRLSHGGFLVVHWLRPQNLVAQGESAVMEDCRCETPPFDFRDFESRPVGVDVTNGRYGEVSIETCRLCGCRWLRYAVEYEAFSGSGRWYRGRVSGEVAQAVTPETAIDALRRLEWHFAGGSGFESTGFKRSGPVLVDL